MLRLATVQQRLALYTELQSKFFKASTIKQKLSWPGPHGADYCNIKWLSKPKLWGYFKKEKETLFCWFGSELPANHNQPMTMDIEINISLKGNGLRRAGRAIVDDQNRLYLGHRGGLGGGRGGQIPIKSFSKKIGLEKQAFEIGEDRTQQAFIFGPISDKPFIPYLAEYVRKCRRLRSLAKNQGLIGPTDAEDDELINQNKIDDLEMINVQIKARRGQRRFRNKLLRAYGNRCAISNCNVLDVLEAAHITPFLGEKTNRVTNGLLLRADLHTLLDCGLIAIDPTTRMVILHAVLKISDNYKQFSKTRLREPYPSKLRPTDEILADSIRKMKTETS